VQPVQHQSTTDRYSLLRSDLRLIKVEPSERSTLLVPDAVLSCQRGGGLKPTGRAGAKVLVAIFQSAPAGRCSPGDGPGLARHDLQEHQTCRGDVVEVVGLPSCRNVRART